MIVKIERAALKEAKWHEYVLRFLFGGLITAAAGVIGKTWGPEVAGLFLAFPAVFPASATLVEKHETERKQRKGLHGAERGIDAASDDALGAGIGSVGLLAFAAICWRFIPRYFPIVVLAGAAVVWFLTAVTIWLLRKRFWKVL